MTMKRDKFLFKKNLKRVAKVLGERTSVEVLQEKKDDADRVGDGEALFSTLAMLLCESHRLIKGFKPFAFKNVDSVFTLETTITGKDGAEYLVKGSELRLPKPKKAGDAPHWRRMQIEFSCDSMFHQRVRQWAGAC